MTNLAGLYTDYSLEARKVEADQILCVPFLLDGLHLYNPTWLAVACTGSECFEERVLMGTCNQCCVSRRSKGCPHEMPGDASAKICGSAS